MFDDISFSGKIPWDIVVLLVWNASWALFFLFWFYKKKTGK